MTSPPLGSRPLTHDEALAIGEKIFGMSRADTLAVEIEHIRRTVTHVVYGRAVTTDDGDELRIGLRTSFGTRYAVTISTDQLDDAALARVVQDAETLALLQVGSDERLEATIKEHFSYLPVSLWHDTTIDAMATARRHIIPQLAERCAQSQLHWAATVGLMARSILYMQKTGVTAFAQETDSECTVTVRTQDGSSSGWAGQAARDWTAMRPEVIATQAIDIARRSANPSALEPGRRTAILGPAAVAQLLRFFAPAFDAGATDQGRTPLSKRRTGGNKLGMRVFDPRLSVASDPNDPDGGFVPFFESSSNPASGNTPGAPIPNMSWVENGVLKNLAYNQAYGLLCGKPYCERPYSLRVSGGTMTLDEMIASCKEGIYVNRFSNVTLADAFSGLLSGVTRDGCFLVKDGKIDRPIKNFRFLDSPFLFLNNLDAIGVSARTAFGYTPPARGEYSDTGSWPPIDRAARWPRMPMIVPPLMVRDFNFVALSDAI